MKQQRFWLSLVALVAIVTLLAQCGPTPAPVQVPQTVVVQQTVEVPKEVVVTQQVEVTKEVVITATPEPVAKMPAEITFMDDQSGANFQQWFQTIALPAAEKALGFKIKYVVGKDAEVFERMKAWQPGQGDFAVLFPKSTAAIIKAGIPLETLDATKVPNIAKVDPILMQTTEGVAINNLAAPYWYSTYALIYNSDKVKTPPASWAEFYDQRASMKGHIGMIRPDAKSSAGWRQPYAFLNAFYNFCNITFDSKDPKFQEAWAKLKDFYTYAQLPLAAEPTNMFENFNAGDTWITLYAMDYSLWSARQGTMPPTTKAAFLKEGVDAGGQAYFVVPTNIPDDQKAAAYALINWLLSDAQQVALVSNMFQYEATMVEDQVPPLVWEQIPKPEVAHAAQIKPECTNADAIQYIKDNGLELVPK